MAHNAIFISNNATFYDVKWVFTFLIEILKIHAKAYFSIVFSSIMDV